MSVVVNGLLVVLIVIMGFAGMHLVFTAGRIYEDYVIVRELDEKIDKLTAKIKAIDQNIV